VDVSISNDPWAPEPSTVRGTLDQRYGVERQALVFSDGSSIAPGTPGLVREAADSGAQEPAQGAQDAPGPEAGQEDPENGSEAQNAPERDEEEVQGDELPEA
jgi:hypothetical protein